MDFSLSSGTLGFVLPQSLDSLKRAFMCCKHNVLPSGSPNLFSLWLVKALVITLLSYLVEDSKWVAFRLFVFLHCASLVFKIRQP